MNTLTKRLATAAAAACALALIPLAAAGVPAARAATAPDPCKVPMAGAGQGADGAWHVYYRATCDQPAVQLATDSSANGFGLEGVLMPGGQDVAVADGTDLETINIATKAVTMIPQDQPLASWGKTSLSVAPDGSAVAFIAGDTRDNGAHTSVYVQKLDGSPAYPISDPAAAGNGQPAYSTAWSHDGRYVAYQVEGSKNGIAWAPASGSGPQQVITSFYVSPPVGNYNSLAWIPDDQGLLAADDALYATNGVDSGHLEYADLTSGTVTPTALAIPGKIAASISVDQHWDVFVETSGGTPNELRTEEVWLGDPGTVTTLPPVASAGGIFVPTVSMAGPADPRPANFPPTGPTPTPTPTPTPKVVLFELRGTRGAGDPGTDPQDGVTKTFTQEVQARTSGPWTPAKPGGDILAVPVNYPAVAFLGSTVTIKNYVTGAYVNSELDGIIKLGDAIRKYQQMYPKARIAFVGYSAGAQVVRTVIASMTHAEQNRVAFVVTYGDPLFLSGQSFDRGHWIPGKLGIYWAARYFDRTKPNPGFTLGSIRQGHAGMTAALASRTEDWVKLEDPIAQ